MHAGRWWPATVGRPADLGVKQTLLAAAAAGVQTQRASVCVCVCV